MKVKDVINYLDSIAPRQFQEHYDNVGLIIGSDVEEVNGVLVCLDCIESVVDEAIDKNCNLIVAHHPIIFDGLKKINGANYIERTVIKAIKNNISIYAIHTNLDNVIDGVNGEIANKLKLVNRKILSPKDDLLIKLAVFVPLKNAEEVRNAIFEAGGGCIGNYSDCSFNVVGKGSFKGGDEANPVIGEKGHLHFEEEVKVEVIFPSHLKNQIVEEMIRKHPYEEVAYDLYPVKNKFNVGSGLIGELEEEVDALLFLKNLKEVMNTSCIRYTTLVKQKVKRIAVCGGSGSFLLSKAIQNKADVFISADFKYHQFFDADNQLVIADIGHFESEQYTIELIAGRLKENFSNFAIRLTDVNTNPINYL